jgi:hypothetical protein
MTITIYSQKISTIIVSIDPYLKFQHYEHFKRLTLCSSDTAIEFLKDFEFNWGYNYKISVEKTELAYRLSDGALYSYTIKDIISKTKVADTLQFNLFLDAERYYYSVDANDQEMNKTFKQTSDSTFIYFDKVEIEVPFDLKDEFSLIVNGDITKVGTFIFVDDKRIKLINL